MVLIQPCRWRQVSIHVPRNCSTRSVHSRVQNATAEERSEQRTDRYLASSASLEADGSASTLRLGSYVSLWFTTSCIFNLLNKVTLNVFPMPLFLSTWQLMASSMFMVSLWVLGLHPKPNPPPRFLFHLLPVAFFHTIGHVAACVSFTKMAVSFTHVVKASEPVFTVALSTKLLGVR